MKVIIGGTFNCLHDGHKALFEKAFDVGELVLIGLTSNEMAADNRVVKKIKDYDHRKRILIEYLSRNFQGAKFKIEKIDESFNQSLTMDLDADAIVASEGKKDVIKKINELRKNNQLKHLKPILVPYILSEDGTPIKSTNILNGEMDEHGKILGTIIAIVGSINKVKLNAVKNMFTKIFPNAMLSVKSVKVETGVQEQPFGKDTIKGAINRAKAALGSYTDNRKGAKQPDFGVGIEAGLFWNPSLKIYFDVQYCAVIDKAGRVTIGHGSGFQYPKKVITEVKQDKTIGIAMEELTGIKKIGQKGGAIGYLSNKILDRTELTEQAVLMAMIPRLRKELEY